MKSILNDLSRSQRVSILIVIDTLVIISSIFISFLIRLDLFSIIVNYKIIFLISLIVSPFVIFSLYLAKFYTSITRYGGLSIFRSILISSLIGSLIFILILYFGNFSIKVGYNSEPASIIRSLPIIFLLVSVFALISSRYFVQIFLEILYFEKNFYPIGVYSYSKNLLKLADYIENNFNLKVNLFISSSKVFIGSYINNIIVNDIDDKEGINNKKIKYIIVGDLPTNNDERSFILDKLTSLNASIKFLNVNQSGTRKTNCCRIHLPLMLINGNWGANY